MDERLMKIGERIQKNSRRIRILLVIFLVLLIINSIGQIFAVFRSFSAFFTDTAGMERNTEEYAKALSQPMTSLFSFVALAVFSAVTALSALIFRSIEDNQSPFVAGIPKKMKIISILILLVYYLSYFFSFAAIVITRLPLAKVNISVAPALIGVILSAVFYCFAMIFDYGLMLSEETEGLL